MGLGGHRLILSLHQGTLCEGWTGIGAGDVRMIHQLCESRGVRISIGLTNTPWVLEFRLWNQDGNTIRFGSDPDI
ncbi:MAG: hypothetical protein CMP98_10040 [Gammaproteobacteria bacterium]|nr:hypothetical protein [Gammaproteobacteria bacterium]OUU08340.1 MAG: hypothetical protein CBB94_10270 [Gammaproteobacteria bacterium TMED34]